MKLSILLFFGALLSLSDQSFVWFDSSKNEKAAPSSRFIVNVVEYSFVNNTEVKTSHKFRCLGILVASDYILTTASCAKTDIGIHIGIQFPSTSENVNEPTHSVIFDETHVRYHQNYDSDKDKEMNNIALISFNPNTVSTDPPLNTLFKPLALGSIPTIADHCTIYGRDVHLANPPSDNVFVIGPTSCYGVGGKQASCSIFDNKDVDACKSIQGAPLICKDNEISGFVLSETRSCTGGSSIQLRYHNVGDFKSWLNYYMVGPTTTVKPNFATSLKLPTLTILLTTVIYLLMK